MSKVKRLRVFAGPNGSGKSTLFGNFSKKYRPGIFINADEITLKFKSYGFLSLSDYNLEATEQDLINFYSTPEAKSLVSKSQENGNSIILHIKNNQISDGEEKEHNYEGAFCALFIRDLLIRKGESFCFETVMSHPGKIEEIKSARTNGYKTYFYFVCTDNPKVNISRVRNRVIKGGHEVPDDKIISRYHESLQNVELAIDVSDKCFFFDNSSELILIASMENNQLNLEVEEHQLPMWFRKFVLNLFQ